MARIAFIGLGNMGLPMARNLVAANHEVTGYDIVAGAVEAFAAEGGRAAETAEACLQGAEFVVTMLPEGQHVREVYSETIIPNAPGDAVLVDCSTIDVETARDVAARAGEAGFAMLDAPVSGGTGGAEAGTLTFMVGGSGDGFRRVQPLLDVMGRTVVHVGDAGTGQVAKICNNLILGISMIATCESLSMGQKLGVNIDALFSIISQSSGQSWVLTTYCPVAGPVPASPANRDYQPGFTTAMMAKDLRLAMDAAGTAGQATRLGAEASRMFDEFLEAGGGTLDFSAIYRKIEAASS
ncbi:MAG: 3-hydroxyisobutyrate dehydrogenase [Alphaproteobacteria bacterium]|nr:3-hydroxyisobutyrate dehydrogenase [Alphaproteobacteria bacterium]